jgi:predicted porin
VSMLTGRTTKLGGALGTVLLLSCGVAQAQSSVTLYGVVDGGLLYTSKTLNPANGQNAGSTWAMYDGGLVPSRFGFRGVEDLGGGLKASFDLESGIDVANGGFNNSNGNLFGRQAWIALESNLGVLKAGVQFSPFFYAVDQTDARSFSLFGSGLVNYVGSVLATSILNSNAVSYSSPTVAGFKGSAMIALGGQAGDFPAGRQYSASLSYTHANLLVEAAFYDGNAGPSPSPLPSTVEFVGRTIGASYRIRSLTVKAAFVNYKVAGSFNSNVYSGGLDYQVRPDIDINGGVWVTSDRNDTANHSLLAAVGGQYYLSKATTLYGQVGVVNNHGAMDTGLSVSSLGALYAVKGTTTGVNVGVRHTF